MEMIQTSDVLQNRGFTQEEIGRLHQLRRAYWERQAQKATATRRRLEFVRWLVATGRMTEQVD